MSRAADHAIHVLAAYITEHLLKRKRKVDLVDAELEIRDALHRFLEECQRPNRPFVFEKPAGITKETIERIEARLADLETAAPLHEQDRIRARLTELEERRYDTPTPHVLARLGNLETEQDRIRARLPELEARLAELEESRVFTVARIGGLEQKVAELEERR